MSKLLESISEEEFKNRIKIRFNNILNGLDKYSNGNLEYKDNNSEFHIKEENFIKFFQSCLKENNGEAIVDFYIKKLDNHSKIRLLESLDGADKAVLEKHISEIDNMKSVYFNVNSRELMDFITRLNTRELLFCTVYFEKYPMTIWGNYNLKFPIFFEDNNVLNIYEKISQDNNMIIRDIVNKVKNNN